MRITIPAPTYLPSRRANTIQVMKMAQAAAALGHAVLVLVPRHKTAHWSEPGWDELAHHYGLSTRFSVRWLPAHPAWRSYDFGLRALRAAKAWEADLVYTRHPQTAALAALFGRPTILEVHDLPQGAGGPLLFRQFLRGRGARRLVSISQSLMADLQARYPIPDRVSTLVAPDGVDPARFAGLPFPAEARRRLSLPERFTVGYTGHLYPGRGIELILKTAAELPGLTFLLVGGNPEDVDRVRNAAADLPNVMLPGFVPNAELPRYQAACDVLLMPYQHHVAASSGGDIASYLSPMKLFEYLAVGRAILSSDLPVLREILDESCAILLPPDDPGVWTAALRRLAAAPEEARRLGEAARVVSAGCTWDSRAERIFAGLG